MSAARQRLVEQARRDVARKSATADGLPVKSTPIDESMGSHAPRAGIDVAADLSQ